MSVKLWLKSCLGARRARRARRLIQNPNNKAYIRAQTPPGPWVVDLYGKEVELARTQARLPPEHKRRWGLFYCNDPPPSPSRPSPSPFPILLTYYNYYYRLLTTTWSDGVCGGWLLLPAEPPITTPLFQRLAIPLTPYNPNTSNNSLQSSPISRTAQV